jgi:hypothetical protein
VKEWVNSTEFTVFAGVLMFSIDLRLISKYRYRQYFTNKAR